MPNQYTVEQFVKAFGQVYQTIDIRAALIKHEDQWRTVCVVVRIHMAPENIIKREFQKLKIRYGKMDSPRFRIIQHCYSFSELGQLTDAFLKGHLKLEDQEIQFDGKNILAIRGDIPWFTGSRDKPSVMDWPVLRASSNLSEWRKFHELFQSDLETLRDVEVAGYHDPYSAIRQLLEADFQSSTNALLVVELEVPARIDAVKAKRTDIHTIGLEIHIQAHQALSNISCNVRQKRTTGQRQVLTQQVLSLKPSKAKTIRRKWTGQLELNTGVEDYVEIELIDKSIGLLYRQDISPVKSLRTEERNPLFTALTRFCSWEQVKDLLERPDVTQAPKNVEQISLKNKGKLYEVSIQWLLSNLGFRAIWLHGYEKMKAGKYDYGSIDCLAYHELRNVLLLVNCTTGPPDPHEINRQMELQRLLSEETFHNASVRLYSVVFTASHRPGVRQGVFTDANVRIFYREDIPKLLALIKKGKEAEFVDAFINPMISLSWE
jgi:hypothetical protein